MLTELATGPTNPHVVITDCIYKMEVSTLTSTTHFKASGSAFSLFVETERS